MQTDESPDESAARAPADMVPLHPNQLWLLRIRAVIAAAIVLPAVQAADLGPLRETPLAPGLVPALVALAALVLIFWLPRRRYRAWGYGEAEDELHIRHGLLFRMRTVVPFGRVQHIDVAHGPIERGLGLATLILHTAGTRGSSVSLPGLAQAEAERLRDRIRAKIRQDLV